MIRLMPKSKIIEANQAAKKREIDEAKKLSKQINKLRETLADETLALDKWRAAMVDKIKAETDSLKEREAYLQTEVQSLEQRQIKLLVPLDELKVKLRLEWQEVNRLKAKCELTNKELQPMKSDLEKAKTEQIKLLAEAKEQSFLLSLESEKKLESAIIQSSEAKELRKKAEFTLKEATDVKIKLEQEKEKLELRETVLLTGQSKLEEDRFNLNIALAQLADRNATLKRTLSRIKT